MANQKKVVKTKKHLAREQREAKQMRIILIITIVVAVIVLSLVVYGLVDQLFIIPNTPVAQVGEDIIKVREFKTQVQYARVQILNQSYQYYLLYQQFAVYGYGSDFLEAAQSYVLELTQPEAFGSDILDQMIDEAVIRQEAAARGITVSEEEIEEALQAAFGFFPEGTYTPTTTATTQSTPTYSETQLALITLTSTPTETATPTETPEVTPTSTEENTTTETEAEDDGTGANDTSEENAETQAETLTPEPSPTITLTPTITPTATIFTTEILGEDLKEYNESYEPYEFDIDDYRELIKTQLLQEKLLEDVITDLEPVKDEVWARHILVETEEEAQTILALFDRGFDFHDLAAQHSLDDSNKDIGGDLGWFDDATMVVEFTDAAFSLEVGEISDPVETSYGFHIIQVLGKRESQMSADDFQTAREEAFYEWLEQLRNTRTDIVIFDEWADYVSDYPEVPQDFLYELYSAGYE